MDKELLEDVISTWLSDLPPVDTLIVGQVFGITASDLYSVNDEAIEDLAERINTEIGKNDED